MDSRKKSSCNEVRVHTGNQKHRNNPRTIRSKTETAFAMSLQLTEKELKGRKRKRDTTVVQTGERENKVALGKGKKREFPHDSEKCHGSTEIGKARNKGM